MGRKRKAPDIIILEQPSGSGLGWLAFGAALGAGVALLLAPATGEETRKELRRRAKELRLSAADAIGGLREKFDALTSSDDEPEGEAEEAEEEGDPDQDEAFEAAEASDVAPETLSDARAELERRLAAARARRRVREPDEEEPVA